FPPARQSYDEYDRRRAETERIWANAEFDEPDRYWSQPHRPRPATWSDRPRTAPHAQDDWAYAQAAGYGAPPPPPQPAAQHGQHLHPARPPRIDRPFYHASGKIRTELRWVQCTDGVQRPMFQHPATRKPCCAQPCDMVDCPYGHPPCQKPLRSPPEQDLHETHRCSKCKEVLFDDLIVELGTEALSMGRQLVLALVQPNSTRKASQLRMQACCTAWCQIVRLISNASDLFNSLQSCKDTDKHISAVLREYRPGTLERYLRIAWLLVIFISSSDAGFSDIALHHLLDFLAAARASHSQDREVHQISAQSAIKALRWLSRQAQWNALAIALDSPVIKAYAVQGTAKDRREALPIPWCLVASWEQVLCQPRTALCTKLALGAMLLATHASLRFGDVQRIDISSLSLSCSALHGTCYATKTTNMGQPFAVALGGISGRDIASCWTLHWLASLRIALEQSNTPKHQVDFLWFNAQPELAKLQELAPASYCTAMLTLRWAATLPWQQPGQGLHSAEAKQLTLHSMKSTALASAAQLRLDKEIRLLQGHHRDSADLYSRNDVFASLDVQHRISKALASGWRAERSIARGGQAPVPETARASPSYNPPSDEEADMVERAALWHALSLDGTADRTSRTACGMELGIAAQVSEFPQVDHLLVRLCPAQLWCTAFSLVFNSTVPDPLCNALKGTGIQSIPDIAFACNEVSDLSRFCDASTYAQLWQDLGIDEPEHSPAMARLRRAWHRIFKLTTQENTWMETQCPA
ncbi:unnamed protein product, partial [Symbiodinium microadriaticum]